jgi:hypothetical protein
MKGHRYRRGNVMDHGVALAHQTTTGGRTHLRDLRRITARAEGSMYGPRPGLIAVLTLSASSGQQPEPPGSHLAFHRTPFMRIRWGSSGGGL